MSPPPAVSVVVPAYNAAGTLVQAASSVLRQSMDDIELIVVDDGSTDETLNVARQIDDPRIRAISQPNAGVAAARNSGIKAAHARWVAFLDADDLWLPEKLARQLSAIQASPGAVAAQSSVYFVNDKLQVLSLERCRRSRNGLLDVLGFRNTPAVPSTLLADRGVLEAIGGFDESLAILEDWELMIRLARHGGLVNIEDPLALYRVHPGNRSRDVQLHVKPGLKVLDRLFADPDLPAEIRVRRKEVYGRLYLMLAGGAFRRRNWRDWRKWTWRAILSDPRNLGRMTEMPFRRLRRAWERGAHHNSPQIHSG